MDVSPAPMPTTAPRDARRMPKAVGATIVIAALVAWFGYIWWISGVMPYEERFEGPGSQIKCAGFLKRTGLNDYKRHGLWTTYHRNGEKESQGHYDRGHQTGLWTYFDEKGHVVKEHDFPDGG